MNRDNAMTLGNNRENAKTPAISVILPTYNRHDVLEKVLHALNGQTGIAPDQFEVIVVDDCSTDPTPQTLAAFSGQAAFPFQYMSLDKNGGPARARNQALKKVQSDLVLIIGDDIVPTPDFVQKHVEWHQAHPCVEDALLGFITWPEQMEVTPFMRWLETGGQHYFFNYDNIQENESLDPIYFYTCNVSLKMALIQKAGRFDESFPYASHEDLEYGYRLQACGMQLYYSRAAVGYHWHPLSLEGVARRVYLMGYSSILFWQKAPDRVPRILQILRVVIRECMGVLPVTFVVRHLIASAQAKCSSAHPVVWRLLLAMSFWKGMHDGRRSKPVQLFFSKLSLSTR